MVDGIAGWLVRIGRCLVAVLAVFVVVSAHLPRLSSPCPPALGRSWRSLDFRDLSLSSSHGCWSRLQRIPAGHRRGLLYQWPGVKRAVSHILIDVDPDSFLHLCAHPHPASQIKYRYLCPYDIIIPTTSHPKSGASHPVCSSLSRLCLSDLVGQRAVVCPSTTTAPQAASTACRLRNFVELNFIPTGS